jgi:hypothetical protein
LHKIVAADETIVPLYLGVPVLVATSWTRMRASALLLRFGSCAVRMVQQVSETLDSVLAY